MEVKNLKLTSRSADVPCCKLCDSINLIPFRFQSTRGRSRCALIASNGEEVERSLSVNVLVDSLLNSTSPDAIETKVFVSFTIWIHRHHHQAELPSHQSLEEEFGEQSPLFLMTRIFKYYLNESISLWAFAFPLASSHVVPVSSSIVAQICEINHLSPCLYVRHTRVISSPLIVADEQGAAT